MDGGIARRKKLIYPDYTGGYVSYETKAQYDKVYPLMPARIVDNLLCRDAKISVVPWSRVERAPAKLKWLVDETARAGRTNTYDLRRPMRRRDHSRYSQFGLMQA